MNDSTGSFADGTGPGPHMDEDQCLSLLHGLLPSAEATRILTHLAVCPACEHLFRERAAEREHLRASGTLRTLPDGKAVFVSHLDEHAAREPAAADSPAARHLGHPMRGCPQPLLSWEVSDDE